MRRGAGPCWRMAWAVLAAWVLAGCMPRPAGDGWAGWQRMPLHAAEFFQLWQRGGDRLLITFGPAGTTDTTGLFLVPGEGGGGEAPSGAVRVAQPLRRAALLSTTHASFLSALGRADAVVGCAHVDRLRDSLVLALARTGAIAEIGGAEGVDREKVLMLAPQALFVYPYGGGANLTALGPLPVIPVAEYLEPDPLGRAEWIRAFGVLLGRDSLAQARFAAILQRYGQVRASVPPGLPRPEVFFGSSWKGTWSVPSGRSYMARLIDDAGGHYLFDDRRTDGNINVDLEQVLLVGARAAFWGRVLDEQRPVRPGDVAGDDGRILALPAFRGHGAFFANSRTSDLFGQAGLEPDVVLQDLAAIFHPSLFPGHRPVYFRPVQ